MENKPDILTIFITAPFNQDDKLAMVLTRYGNNSNWFSLYPYIVIGIAADRRDLAHEFGHILTLKAKHWSYSPVNFFPSVPAGIDLKWRNKRDYQVNTYRRFSPDIYLLARMAPYLSLRF